MKKNWYHVTLKDFFNSKPVKEIIERQIKRAKSKMTKEEWKNLNQIKF